MTERLVQFTALPLEGRLETMHTLKGYIICSITWRVSEVSKTNCEAKKFSTQMVLALLFSWYNLIYLKCDRKQNLFGQQEIQIIQRNPGEAIQPNIWTERELWMKISVSLVSDGSLCFIVNLWLDYLFLKFPIQWSLGWIVDNLQNYVIYNRLPKHQQQTDMNIRVASNISPKKCLLISPVHGTQKGIRMKRPLCWTKVSTAQWVEEARYRDCNSVTDSKAPKH